MALLNRKPAVFLTASWEHLIMLNYEVPQELLEPYLPAGAQLDTFHGKSYVSIVGFRFCNTRILGIKVPFHENFPEVNLRFYVKYLYEGIWRRGTVFISEIVPKPMVAWAANWLFNEHYEYAPMDSAILRQLDNTLKVEYQWKKKQEWNHIMVEASARPQTIQQGSMEEFITEHYWGYTQVDAHSMLEYGVEHPTWKVFPVHHFEASFNAVNLYGNKFDPFLTAKPASVLLAQGSDVLIRFGHVYKF